MQAGVIHYNSHAIFEMLEFFTPRNQISQLLITPVPIWTLLKHVLQIAINVQVMGFGHFDHRINHGTGLSAIHTVAEQPVFPAYGKGPG